MAFRPANPTHARRRSPEWYSNQPTLPMPVTVGRSNCVKCQTSFAYPVTLQGSMRMSIVLVIASSLRIQAVNATFFSLPFANKR